MKNARISMPLAPTQFKDKKTRAEKVMAKSKITAAKGKKAVDEGRDKKATRLLKKAARQETRSIRIEERKKDRELIKRGFNNMSRDGIA